MYAAASSPVQHPQHVHGHGHAPPGSSPSYYPQQQYQYHHQSQQPQAHYGAVPGRIMSPPPGGPSSSGGPGAGAGTRSGSIRSVVSPGPGAQRPSYSGHPQSQGGYSTGSSSAHAGPSGSGSGSAYASPAFGAARYTGMQGSAGGPSGSANGLASPPPGPPGPGRSPAPPGSTASSVLASPASVGAPQRYAGIGQGPGPSHPAAASATPPFPRSRSTTNASLTSPDPYAAQYSGEYYDSGAAASDLTASLNGMNLGAGQHGYAGPQAAHQAYHQFMTTGPSGQRGSAGSIHSFGSGGGAPSAAQAQAQAQMRHAQSEIYKTASEVEPQNSLAAIASEVDDAASALRAGDVPTGELGLKQVQGDADVANTPAAVVQAAQQQQQQQGGYWGGDAYGYDYAAQAGAGYAPNGQAYYAAQPAAGYAGGYDGAAYAQQQHAAALAAQQAAAAAGMAGNPYFAAAQGYLGYPGADGAGGSSASAGSHVYPHGGLVRQSTSLSMASSNSAAAQRKKRQNSANAQQQTLPFNKPFVDEYRHRMKADPDPEAQFAFAKYLIEAAKKVNDPKDGPKQARKYRDNLLSESLKLIKRLATTGMDLGKPPYAEAQFFLANCFGNGSLGLQVDHEKAYNLYVQASKQNHPAATYRTAVCNEVGAGTKRDHHRAVLFYRKASALGDTAGMYKLGMIMLNGLLGQPRNPREAVVWLKRAAGQADEENPHALHELGLLHEKPNNGVVMHDEAYARELFTQAAQLGYAPSQFKLGSAYEYGALTCPVDPRRSIAWYTKAAGKNDGESELALSGWYLTGSEGVLKQSDSEAYLWARRAASKGIPKAEYAVGYYSEVGIGVEANVEEAKRWYMRAAAQGNKRAMQRLTELKKLGARGGKRGARPTRKDAESECTVM